ncbi:hypothetical protein 0305phi8-36p097 [Bacillus phage 0305phi8-36]|uniref:GTP-binding domain n=1 Tax=Bacillus phage 0305phi8-36 TaxID=458639 RepID=UPI00015A1FC0|nr:GTP-binding domain [Bacillus phage 0305phi8-36]ABS83657.1 hypothetical protein 0305phi8-36p097 [Bacillus phage 0305phi8-36]
MTLTPRQQGRKVLTFTGPRPQNLFGFDKDNPDNKMVYIWLTKKILAYCKKYPNAHFITGGALGVDTWAAEIVIEARKLYPDITLEIAVPHEGHGNKWRPEARKHYKWIKSKADVVTMVSNQPFTMRCMQARNEYMVDNATAIIGVWNGSSGTTNCLKYAQRKKLPMLVLEPNRKLVRKVRRGEKLFAS